MADTKTGQLARGNCAGTGVTTRGPEGGRSGGVVAAGPAPAGGSGPDRAVEALVVVIPFAPAGAEPRRTAGATRFPGSSAGE